MSEHPIQGLMDTAMEKLREIVDVNTIIGDPITSPDGTVIIPISKVSFGLGSGGSDLPAKIQKDVFGGGVGAGVSINPIAFLVVSNGNVKLLQLNSEANTADKVVNMVPELIDKISELFDKNSSKKQDKSASKDE